MMRSFSRFTFVLEEKVYRRFSAPRSRSGDVAFSLHQNRRMCEGHTMCRKSTSWTLPVLVCVAAAGLMGRTAASATWQASRDKETVTVTGCIQHLDKTAAAYGAATARPQDRPPTFALANAKLRTETATSTASAIPEVPELDVKKPAGTAAAADSKGTTNIYQLEGEDRLLAAHLGHSVEITGPLQARSSGRARGSADAAVGTTTEWNLVAPTLRVDTVKMLRPSCSE
jgi:hypothetical protein